MRAVDRFVCDTGGQNPSGLILVGRSVRAYDRSGGWLDGKKCPARAVLGVMVCSERSTAASAAYRAAGPVGLLTDVLYRGGRRCGVYRAAVPGMR